MARVSFINPNEPEQPVGGVYRWFYRLGEREITFYVGNSGGRQPRVSKPSTLKRGIMEAQRSCLSSDKGSTLDTDFIVGTAIIHLRKNGFDCYWEHISDEPHQERIFCRKFASVLQDGTDIKKDFRLRKADGRAWIFKDVNAAEMELFRKFDECLPSSA